MPNLALIRDGVGSGAPKLENFT